MSAYRIQAILLAREGESESKRQAGILHAHIVQEVRYAVNNVVKKLGNKMADMLKKFMQFMQF